MVQCVETSTCYAPTGADAIGGEPEAPGADKTRRRLYAAGVERMSIIGEVGHAHKTVGTEVSTRCLFVSNRLCHAGVRRSYALLIQCIEHGRSDKCNPYPMGQFREHMGFSSEVDITDRNNRRSLVHDMGNVLTVQMDHNDVTLGTLHATMEGE